MSKYFWGLYYCELKIVFEAESLTVESKHTLLTGTFSLLFQFSLFLFLSLLSLTLFFGIGFFLSLFLGFVVAAFAL